MSLVLRGPADVLAVNPVIPVVVIDDARHAVPLARALLRGGIRIIEITLRTSVALSAIERVASEVPEMVIGAGTVITPEQAVAVQWAGARFIVTPGTTPRLLDFVLDSGVPLLAGASTVTEMMQLAEKGLNAMKFFPAEECGGRAYLSAVAGPFPELRFCPTGGISAANAADYLALANVGCVGGSWLTPKATILAEDWDKIEHFARQAALLNR